MKAARFHSHGGPEVLVYEDAPRPVLEHGDVLVEVRACGVNHLDIWTRIGRYRTRLPHILGTDVSGVIAEVSADDRSLAVGRRVVIYPVLSDGTCRYCLAGHPNLCVNVSLLGSATDGGYAQFVRVPAKNVLSIEELAFPIAASLPVNFATAWNGLVSKAAVGPDDYVLVWAGGSGVGHAAIEISKLFGAKVIATAGSDEKLALAASLGADVTVNHRTEDVVERVRNSTDGVGASIVFDHVGAETWDRSIHSMAKGGTLVSLGVTTGENAGISIGTLYRSELKIAGTYAFTKDELKEVVKLAEEGKLRPHIFKEIPLDSASRAHALLESRESFGKIVLLPEEG